MNKKVLILIIASAVIIAGAIICFAVIGYNGPEAVTNDEELVDDAEETNEVKFDFQPVDRAAPVWNINAQNPSATKEPREIIEEEAPYYRGESNV